MLVAFDGMWLEWYLHRFGGESPFRRRGLDIKTLAMVAMGAGYRQTAKSALPRHWRPTTPHTHLALDDAIEQGELFFNVVRELNVQRGVVLGKTQPTRLEYFSAASVQSTETGGFCRNLT